MAVIIPQIVMDALGLKPGDDVDITAEHSKAIITPTKSTGYRKPEERGFMQKDGDKSLNKASLPLSEADLLEGLNEDSVHGDELAELTQRELDPLERLRGSVKGYERPADPAWEEYLDKDGVSEDFMIDRDKPSSKETK